MRDPARSIHALVAVPPGGAGERGVGGGGALGGVHSEYDNSGRAMLERAKRRVSRMDFVMITER